MLLELPVNRSSLSLQIESPTAGRGVWVDQVNGFAEQTHAAPVQKQSLLFVRSIASGTDPVEPVGLPGLPVGFPRLYGSQT